MTLDHVGQRLRGRVERWLGSAQAVGAYLAHGREVRRWADRSMLSPVNRLKYRQVRCPVCGHEDYHPILQMPFGYPEGQNHSLLYFDDQVTDLAALPLRRGLLDRTLGFLVSVPWNFCHHCQNASLAIRLSQQHLSQYYQQHLIRYHPVHPNRRRTKELHGAFLARYLKPQSRVLDFGAAEGLTAAYLARLGHEVIACELSRNYETALRQGPFQYINTIAGFPEESLDAISLHHVLEHLADPVASLRQFHRLLRPGGLLMIQVPDLSLQFLHYAREIRRSVYALVNPPVCALNSGSSAFREHAGTASWLDALDNNHVIAFTPEGLRYGLAEARFTLDTEVQSTPDRLVWDFGRYAWKVDEETGNTPNGLTVLARRDGHG